MSSDPLEKLIGIKLLVIVAGFVGAVVQLYYHTALTWMGAITSVVAGVGCARQMRTAL
jgi:energy-converting hydrogenase Eha subunit C